MTARVVPSGPRARSRAAGAALSGVLLAGVFQPFPPLVALLVFVALVPLFRGLEQGDDPRAGAEVGAWFGVTFWTLQLAWVPTVGIRIHAWWPWTAWAGQVVLLALMSAGMGAGYVVLRRRRVPPAAAAIVAWVAVEWARGHLLGPLSFPWSGLALPLARLPVLAQPAAWGGETLLAAGVVAVNAALATAGKPLDEPGGARVLALGLVPWAFVALWALFGFARLELLQGRVQPRARAVVVQPALSLEEKRGAGAEEVALASLRSGLAEAAELVSAGGASLVVFPETHLPLAAILETGQRDGGAEVLGARSGGPGPWPATLTAEIRDWASTHGADVLVGGYRLDEMGLRNSLLHLGEAGLVDAYDKRALVPGVERGPGGLVPGADPRPLDVEGRPGVLICIESAWTSLGRRQARAGAGWLLNVTNDAWLGEGRGAGGMTTPAFHQHPWHLVLRSVETGRGAIRVANNGWTGSVDPLGRWGPALPPHRPGVVIVSVHALASNTIFVRVGDGLGPLCLALLVLLPLTRRPTPAG